MGDRLYFQTTKFENVNASCDSFIKEREPSYGYRLWDSYDQAFDDSMTLEEAKAITPEKALKLIRENENDFFITVANKDGFIFNGDWIELGSLTQDDEEDFDLCPID